MSSPRSTSSASLPRRWLRDALVSLNHLRLASRHAISQNELGQLIIEGLLTTEHAKAVPEACRALCQELAPRSMELVDAFGIPTHMAQAPIAMDWETYNVVDNQGEIVPAHDGSYNRFLEHKRADYPMLDQLGLK